MKTWTYRIHSHIKDLIERYGDKETAVKAVKQIIYFAERPQDINYYEEILEYLDDEERL